MGPPPSPEAPRAFRKTFSRFIFHITKEYPVKLPEASCSLGSCPLRRTVLTHGRHLSAPGEPFATCPPVWGPLPSSRAAAESSEAGGVLSPAEEHRGWGSRGPHWNSGAQSVPLTCSFSTETSAELGDCAGGHRDRLRWKAGRRHPGPGVDKAPTGGAMGGEAKKIAKLGTEQGPPL